MTRATKGNPRSRLWSVMAWDLDRRFWWWEAGYWRVRHSQLIRVLWLLGWRQVTLQGVFRGDGSTWCVPWRQQMRHWTREQGIHFIPRAEWKRIYRLDGLTGYTERERR